MKYYFEIRQYNGIIIGGIMEEKTIIKNMKWWLKEYTSIKILKRKVKEGN